MKNIKTGHIINIVNFDRLIGICKSYDLLYNPSKKEYVISALESQSASSKSILANVTLKEIAYAKDSNERELLFMDLKRFSTRVMLAAKSSGVTTVHFNDLVNVNRKIQGRRAVPITAEEKAILLKQKELKKADPNAKPLKKNRVSQLSFDRMLSNFSNLVEILKATPEFQPNEVDLQLVSLKAKLDLMSLSNQVVSDCNISLSKARFERNNFMYLQENNLVATAMAVKNYSKSVFGARSVQNKQLSEIKFSRLKK